MKATKPRQRKPAKSADAKPAEAPPAPTRALVPTTPPAPDDDTGSDPFRDLDRSVNAAVARATAGVSPFAALETWSDWALHLSRAPGRQAELAQKAWSNAFLATAYGLRALAGKETPPPFQPKKTDPRFDHPGWAHPPYALFEQNFLAVQDWWDQATGALHGVRRQDSDRLRFMVRQMLDVVAPSNFPALNPAIVEETIRQGGKNLWAGAYHFFEDYIQTITQARRAAPKGFEIGKDLACTPGKVIYRNQIMELIQYAPSTGTVHPEPVLIVPAWIMKYYVLDLAPENSLIRYLVAQGYTVFTISWVNPKGDLAELSLEDYRKRGIMEALDAVNAVVPGQKVHANGYCLGGTLLAIAAATMARDGDDRLASVTLMAAQVDFAEAGELLYFLDESQVSLLEDLMWAQGYLDRPQMARTFAAIRAEDLIYTRAVRRYFLGRSDLPSDLGVWNGDTTRMPARMHGEYLRSLFLDNRLTAGRFAVEGRVIALKDISVPLFVVGTESDHIAPWRSVYKAALFTDSDLTFVLTKGGHNGGILSEPGHPRRHFRIGHRLPNALYTDPDTWLGRHEPEEGSWWPAWTRWLDGLSAAADGPPPGMGAPDKGYRPICDAPGSYIHQT